MVNIVECNDKVICGEISFKTEKVQLFVEDKICAILREMERVLEKTDPKPNCLGSQNNK